MKGIIFDEHFFKSVVDGCKTQTRRIIKPQPTYSDVSGIKWKGYAYGIVLGIVDKHEKACHNFVKSALLKYKVGDVLYIKEPFLVSLLFLAKMYDVLHINIYQTSMIKP